MTIYRVIYWSCYNDHRRLAFFLKKEEALKCFYKICRELKNCGWFQYYSDDRLCSGHMHSRCFLSVKKPKRGTNIRDFERAYVWMESEKYNVFDTANEFFNTLVFYENPLIKKEE